MGKRITFSIVISLLVLTVVGCAAASPQPFAAERSELSGQMDSAEPQAPMEESEAGARAADYATTERLIIRNANLDIVVQDTEETVDNLNVMAEELGGYVIESNLQQYEEGMEARLRIRVPADSLDTALNRIRELAVEINSQNVSGQDVTEEYVDLQSRMRHLEATEERLLTFMQEAEDTEAALQVYDRLQNIQAEIEQVRGRIQYLEESAAMATINVNITPSELAQPIQVGGWRPQGTLRDAFESLIKVLQFLVDALIVIVVLIAPVVALIALPLIGLFFLVRGVIRRRRRKKEKKEKEKNES
jgi:hypothetical protein